MNKAWGIVKKIWCIFLWFWMFIMLLFFMYPFDLQGFSYVLSCSLSFCIFHVLSFESFLHSWPLQRCRRVQCLHCPDPAPNPLSTLLWPLTLLPPHITFTPRLQCGQPGKIKEKVNTDESQERARNMIDESKEKEWTTWKTDDKAWFIFFLGHFLWCSRFSKDYF